MSKSAAIQPPKEMNGLIGWFLYNPVAANLLMLLLVIGGLLTVFTMVREVFPTIDPRRIVITVPYPGASPQDVEDAIARRVEEVLNGIQGIRRFESRSYEGTGVVIIEIKDFADSQDVLNDVENSIKQLNNFPPEDAEQVTVRLVKRRADVLSLAIHGDVDESFLHQWAERLETELLALPEVSLVELDGGRDRQVTVTLSHENLRKYNLSIEDVGQRLRNFSLNLPAGIMKTKTEEIVLRIQQRQYYAQGLGDMVIRALPDGSIVRLKDIAHLTDGFEDDRLLSRYDDQPALFLRVLRSDTEDALVIEKAIKAHLQATSLPSALTVRVIDDATDILKDRMNLLLRNAITGFALVFLVLLLFLDLKLAFWTSVCIPISFLGGIFVASYLGVTMNMITLFALIVVLGIVVDDAIIIGESIFDAQRRDPYGGRQAVLRGVKSVSAPVTVGVLTTVAAFAPLITASGVLGQIMRPIPLVVISILLVSLFEAFFILPCHLTGSGSWSRGIVKTVSDRMLDIMDRFSMNILTPVVKFALRWRYVTLALAGLFCFLAVLFIKVGIVRVVFFPHIESDRIIVDLEMPAGTGYEVTEERIDHLIAAASKVRDEYEKNGQFQYVRGIVAFVGKMRPAGSGGPMAALGGTRDSSVGQVEVHLVPSAQRYFSAIDFENAWRKQIGHLPGIKHLSFNSDLVNSGADITLDLIHSDSAKLEQAASWLTKAMRSIDGVDEVHDTLEAGKQEFIFELTPAGLAAGLTPQSLGQQLRHLFYGYEVDRLQRGRREVKIMVMLDEAQRRSLEGLLQARIVLPNGELAALGDMARIRKQVGYASIYRVGGQRVVSVMANIDSRVTTSGSVLQKLEAGALQKMTDQIPGLRWSLEGRGRDQARDMQTIFRNILLAVMIIFTMIAVQLRAYIKPLVILLTIPIGMSSAVFGHLLLGFDLSFMSMFGLVALSGVVVNDSVVLVDYYNQLLAQGISHHEAAWRSVQRRFRPIFLTTATTCLGLLPMLTETSLQAQFLIPMAVSLALGIVGATAVLVFMIPAALLAVEDIKQLVTRLLSSRTASL